MKRRLRSTGSMQDSHMADRNLNESVTVSQPGSSSDHLDKDAHDWQLVEESVVSPCGSSPSSVTCEEYVSDLQELLGIAGPVTKETDDDQFVETASDIPDGVVFSDVEQAMVDGLPLSLHNDSLSFGDTSSTSSMCASAVAVSDGGSEDLDRMSSSPSKSDDSGVDGTELLLGSILHEGDTDAEIIQSSNTDEQGDYSVKSAIAKTRLATTHPRSVKGVNGDGRDQNASKSIPSLSQRGAQAASHNHHLSIIKRTWSLLKTYAQSIGMPITPDLRAKLVTVSSQAWWSGKGRLDSTFLLASGLVSVSALLLWSWAKNRSLSRQLLQSQMDMDHHIMTILKLNDKLARGLQLPITQNCSLGSSMTGILPTSQLVSLSGSFF